MAKKSKAPTNNVKMIRNSPLLEYDASTLYKQMAYAVQAVQTCHVAMVSLMDHIILTREEDSLGKALAARADAVANESQEILRLALHLKSSRSDLQKQILTNACEASRITMSWFKRFLEEHSQIQMDELKPIAEEMRVVFDELDGLRKMKIEEARHMEEAHEKHKRVQRRKKATTIKHQITNEPLADLPNTPPEDAVDIKSLFQAAKAEIDSK